MLFQLACRIESSSLASCTGRDNLSVSSTKWREHEFRAYGYDFPDGPTRLRQLREAVKVILALWTQEQAVRSFPNFLSKPKHCLRAVSLAQAMFGIFGNQTIIMVQYLSRKARRKTYARHRTTNSPFHHP